jgi:hypothetical protein
MKKLATVILFCFSAYSYADPGVMIDIEIILERPSGSGEPTLG